LPLQPESRQHLREKRRTYEQRIHAHEPPYFGAELSIDMAPPLSGRMSRYVFDRVVRHCKIQSGYSGFARADWRLSLQ